MTDTTPAVRITDEMIDAAAEVMWTDRDARHGGPWPLVNRRSISAIQTLATARAAVKAALAAAPVAPGGEDFGDALLALLFKHGLKVALDVSEIETLRLTALRARSEPEAGAVKPAAWRVLTSLNGWSYFCGPSRPALFRGNHWTVQPLYAHPTPADDRLAGSDPSALGEA